MPNKKGSFTKILSLLLALLCCLSMVNITAFASVPDPYGEDFLWSGDDGTTLITYDETSESSPVPTEPLQSDSLLPDDTIGQPKEQEEITKKEQKTNTTVALGQSGNEPYSITIPVNGRARASGNLTVTWFPSYTYNFSLAPGFPIYGQWASYKFNGKLVYCIEPKNLVSTDGKLYSTTNNWSGLSQMQKTNVGFVLLYGATSDGNIPQHIATQALLWEVALGYRDSGFNRTSNYVYNGIISGSSAETYYNTIVTNVKSHAKVPSFSNRDKSYAPSYKLVDNGSGTFFFETTDTTSTLGDMTFPSISGVTFTKTGNKLRIESSNPIPTPVEVELVKTATQGGGSGGLMFWVDTSGSEQVKVDGRPDPVYSYFKITTDDVPTQPPVDDEEYEIRIIKRSSGDNSLLAGAEFEVRHTSHGVIGTFTTNSSGEFSVKVPWAGTYIITELSCPTGFVMPSDPDAEIYVDTDNPLAERTFYNDPYTGIEVAKVDAHTGERLAGASIKITEISTGMSYTKVTDSGGVAHFTNLRPNDYSVQEIVSPTGYILNNTVYPISLESNKLATVTIPNEKMAGLIIKKVDPDGKAIAGAVFELRTGGGTVLTRETTDINGIIFRGNLPTDTYVCEEIQAPTGFVLDPNNPQSIYIDSANPNKEYTLTFVNQRRPAIEILKVDANDPSKVLFGATFRISEQGGSKTWDITTDRNGLAKLENLDPNTTYLVEEIVAPNGYLNSGYREAIVLEVGKTHRITVSNDKAPSLTISKVDEDTGKPLAGAVFRITYDNGASFTDVTTGDNGKAVIDNLPEGWVTILEIRSPDGYLLNNEPAQKYLTAGSETTVVIKNKAIPYLKIVKEDDLTGTRLAGATFKITKKTTMGDILIGEFTTDENGEILLEVEPTRYEIVETKAPNGFIIDTTVKEIVIEYGKTTVVTFTNTAENPIYIAKVDPSGNPLMGAIFRVKNVNGELIGEFKTGRNGYAIVPAEPAFYIIEEIRSPEGYILTTGSQVVELKVGSPAMVEFVNEKAPSFELLKVDKQTGNPVENTVFKITSSTGELIGEFTTDVNGRIFIPQIDGNIKTIVVTEIRSADGYVIDKTPHTVELKAHETVTLTLYNAQTPNFELLKLDADTKEPVMGARFKITSTSGELIGEYDTDINGKISIKDIKANAIVIVEIRSADGYILSNVSHTVQLKEGETASLTVYNKSKAGLQIRKIDSITLFPVSDCVFNVQLLENGAKRDLGNFTSGTNGLIYIPNLEECYLEITEIKAKDGYLLDSTPKTIFVESGKLNVVEFRNQPYSNLVVKKIDSETRTPLAGAIFRIYDEKRVEIGTFESSELGEIFVGNLTNEYVYIQEIRAPKDYILDSSVHKVELQAGKTATIDMKNIKMGSLRIVKIDSVTGKPLAGVTFIIHDAKNKLIGEFKTDQNGIIELPNNLEPQKITIKEIATIEGYILNSDVITAEIKSDETTVVQIKNDRKGSLRIVKIDSVTGKPLAGVTFLIYDAKNNILGEFKTDQNGIIVLTNKIEPQNIKIKEIATIEGYVLNKEIVTVAIKANETTEITIENEPERGRIQIIKKAGEENDITKDKKGAFLSGAVFEIVSEKNEILDTITTDKDGLATSIDLPLGRYAIREKTAPKHYLPLDSVFYAEIKVHDDLVKFEVLNKPVVPKVSIEKRGNVEALTGDSIRYDFSNIQNLSNVPLDNFYFRDVLPTDAVRLEKIFTGTWNERLVYSVTYSTNLKTTHRTLASGLHTNVNNEIDCSPTKLKLAANEYVTEFRFEFGTVKEGFKEVDAPFIFVKVLDDLPNEYRFTNKADVGGMFGGEWVIDKDSWVTIIYRKPKGNLPKTGK